MPIVLSQRRLWRPGQRSGRRPRGFIFTPGTCTCHCGCSVCLTSTPAELTVVIAGLANRSPVACADCASLNGTYVCTFSYTVGNSVICWSVWEYVFPAPICGTTGITIAIMRLTPPGASWMEVYFTDWAAGTWSNDPIYGIGEEGAPWECTEISGKILTPDEYLAACETTGSTATVSA
jgi:hypothetical protein